MNFSTFQRHVSIKNIYNQILFSEPYTQRYYNMKQTPKDEIFVVSKYKINKTFC